MKNLKKLNRNELKTIAGGGPLENLIKGIDAILGVITPAISPSVCQVQCIVNGIVQIKLLGCGSTC